MYPLDEVELAPNRQLTENVPRIALQGVMKGWASGRYTDLTQMTNLTANYPFDNSTFPEDIERQLRRAYWAATSFTD